MNSQFTLGSTTFTCVMVMLGQLSICDVGYFLVMPGFGPLTVSG